MERPLSPWFLGVVGIKYGPVGVFEPGRDAGEMLTEDAELLCERNCG